MLRAKLRNDEIEVKSVQNLFQHLPAILFMHDKETLNKFRVTFSLKQQLKVFFKNIESFIKVQMLKPPPLLDSYPTKTKRNYKSV